MSQLQPMKLQARVPMSSAYFPLIVQCLLILIAPLMYTIYVRKNMSCNSASVKTTAILVGVVFVMQAMCGVVPFTPLPLIVACTLLTVVAGIFGARAYQVCESPGQKKFLKAQLGIFIGMFVVGGATGYMLRRHLGA